MLRWIATGVIGLFLVLDLVLPRTSLGRRGVEAAARLDSSEAFAELGVPLPELDLYDLNGEPVALADLRGHPTLVTFERSVDWCPYTKARLVELRNTFAETDDLVILYVMADNQINEKTLLFIDGLGLRDRVVFLEDRGSASIDRLGLRRPDPEPMEEGVPHPTTYLLDREGVVRFVDVREDYHIWLAPEVLVDALAALR